MPTRHHATGLRLWLALATIYVVWGSTYFGIAVAIETMPPFVMAAIRFALAGSLLLAWDLARDPAARRRPTVRELRDSAVVGILLLGVGNGFVAFGEQTVPSGIAAILVGMIPLWFAVLGWLYYRERLPRIVTIAVVIGFGGVALLVWPEGSGANRFDALGIVTLVIAPIGWAHGSLFAARSARLPARPLTASAFQMLAGAACLAIEGLLTGEASQLRPEAISLASIAAVAYLVLFGSMLAFTVYGWLLRHAPLSLVGTYAYINPVVAIALGTVFLSESITMRTLLASAIIVGAVAIIVTARGRASRLAAAGGAERTAATDSTAADAPAAPEPAAAPAARAISAGGVSRAPLPPRARSG
jgi:drug/metabolite transporter (DMT)-like permease